MKKLLLLLCLVTLPALVQGLIPCFNCGSGLMAQATVEVPNQIMFAGIELNLTDRYRDSIRYHAEALMRNNRYFRLTVERADAYFTVVERILAEEQVPDDMKFLVLQESKLVSDVVSGSNAVGYWQFKKETAREMGMRVDDEVDERMNIVACTHGAGKYLRRHNAQMNNWLYSVLAYYAGLGGARNIINKEYVGANKMDLDINTHWYITKFLAHKMAYESNLHRNPSPPLSIVEYTECENKTLEEIAQSTNVPLEDLAFYNKWVRQGKVPGDKDYTVILPVKASEHPLYMAMQNRPEPCKTENLQPYRKTYFFGLIKADPDPKEKPCETAAAVLAGTDSSKEYRSTAPLFFSWNGIKAIFARKGDNIARLALQADIDREDFLEYNDMRIFDQIVPGQVYYIDDKKKRAQVPYHTVKEGETLWEISQNYGIKMKHLLKKNRMDKPEKLKAGRILWLRHNRPENVAPEYAPVPVVPDAAAVLAAATAAHAPAQPETPAHKVPALTARDSVTVIADTADAREGLAGTKPGNTELPADTDKNGNPVNTSKAADPIKPKPDSAAAAAHTTPKPDSQQVHKATAVPVAAAVAPAHTAPKPDSVHKPAALAVAAAAPDTAKSKNNPLAAQIAAPLAAQPAKSPTDTAKSKPAAAPVPAQAQAHTDCPPKQGFTCIVLQPGQTLYGLSKSLNVKMDSLRVWNGLESKGLQLGMPLYYKPVPAAPDSVAKAPANPVLALNVPVAEKPKKEEPAPAPKPKPDSAAKPAPAVPAKPAASTEPAKEAPKAPVKEPVKEPAKEPVKVPLKEAAKEPAKEAVKEAAKLAESQPDTYTVKTGDTLYRIARNNGITVKQLQEWNGKAAESVAIGEKLVVKK